MCGGQVEDAALKRALRGENALPLILWHGEMFYYHKMERPPTCSHLGNDREVMSSARPEPTLGPSKLVGY